ncbi:hypothetical protein GOP47_0018610 [Adiantum capillus-veneris]|uniref:Uncharacterized protein n=1 Tax=Adiantum capillus-veneris TaxID=13818 RepID=A0A9D4UF01_ADICA|nr:hypothetical protein GOP47_0018610 [Adiantum capillus-veneris]
MEVLPTESVVLVLLLLNIIATSAYDMEGLKIKLKSSRAPLPQAASTDEWGAVVMTMRSPAMARLEWQDAEQLEHVVEVAEEVLAEAVVVVVAAVVVVVGIKKHDGLPSCNAIKGKMKEGRVLVYTLY